MQQPEDLKYYGRQNMYITLVLATNQVRVISKVIEGLIMKLIQARKSELLTKSNKK